VRRTAGLAGRGRVRGCHRCLQPDAGSGVHPAGYFCTWRLRGRPGALLGGAAFIVPGLIVILALSVLFVATSPPLWVLGAGAGAGAAVPAVAVQAGRSLLVPSWSNRASAVRRGVYLAAGLAAAATIGAWLVVVLLGCGVVELLARYSPHLGAGDTRDPDGTRLHSFLATPVLVLAAGGGVLASVAWVALKVGGLLASAVAFTPSFLIVLFGAPRFAQIRGNQRAGAFLDGAGPATIGAILGSAVVLTRELTHPWQYQVLAGALILLLPLRRGVVLALLSSAAIGVIIAFA
jgi:chromate transporter